MNWYEGRLAAFDIETTGTDVESDRIVTAAVTLVGGGEDPQSFDWLVNSGVAIPAEATAVHGITTEQAESQGVPTAGAVEEITTLLATQMADDIPVVAFNAKFDLTTLDREARRHGVEPLVERVGGPDGLLVVDPFVVDWHLNQFRKGRRTLAVLCELYGIPLTDAHAADADALAAARLAWKLGNKYPEVGEIELFELHESQVAWAAEQARNLQEYFDREGIAKRTEPAWPLVPVPAGPNGLEPDDSLASEPA